MQVQITYIKEVAAEYGDEDNGLQLHLLPAPILNQILHGWSQLRTDESHELLGDILPETLGDALNKSAFERKDIDIAELWLNALQADMQDFINRWLEDDYIAVVRERQDHEWWIDQQITEDRGAA